MRAASCNAFNAYVVERREAPWDGKGSLSSVAKRALAAETTGIHGALLAAEEEGVQVASGNLCYGAP